jgi:hypothetical protein
MIQVVAQWGKYCKFRKQVNQWAISQAQRSVGFRETEEIS